MAGMPNDRRAVLTALLDEIDEKMREVAQLLFAPITDQDRHRAIDKLVDLQEEREEIEAKLRG
jgi:hypothetical protein